MTLLRITPMLSLDVELEDGVRPLLVAETYEDELRLRAWLRSATVRQRLVAEVETQLERLAEQARAA